MIPNSLLFFILNPILWVTYVLSDPVGIPDLSRCQSFNDTSETYGINCCPFPANSSITDFTFPPEPAPIRIRRPAHSLTREEVLKYENATKLVKNLPPDHPWSFLQQANIHCAYCNGAFFQLGKSPEVEIQVHASWLFLPFHRCYLYFYERILGKLIGDDSFALPFWNWDNPPGMSIPSAFSNPKSPLYDSLRTGAHNVTDLDFAGEYLNLTSDAWKARNYKVMYRQMVSGSKTARLFFGESSSGSGTLERAPHNVMHVWTGGQMLATAFAGLDPIFFPHHGNSDRMWEVWKGLPGRRELNDTDWLDSAFLFWDENMKLVRIRVRDCLDIAKLGYGYEKVPLPWLSNRSNVSMESEKFPMVVRKLPVELGENNDNVTVEVRRANGEVRRGEEEEVIVVDEIVFHGSAYVRFDVYVTSTVHGRRKFLGRFVHMAVVYKPIEMRTKVKFGLTDVVEELGAGKDGTIFVTLVSRSENVVVKVESVRIEYCT